jgi:hypothetical protein
MNGGVQGGGTPQPPLAQSALREVWVFQVVTTVSC